MKIAYLDLNLFGIFEDYSLMPNRYGGGAVIARHFLKFKDTFHLFAPEGCLNSVSGPNIHAISAEQINSIVNRRPLKTIIPELADFDIILGCYVGLFLNFDGLKAKNVVWSVGYKEYINDNNKLLLLYNEKYQQPIINNRDTRILDFQLGLSVPSYKKYDKKQQLFQCSRHCYEFGSINVAEFCIKHNIKVYFAGPIVNGYELMSYINNKDTFYLGVISEEEKIKYLQESMAYITLFNDWPPPWNLSFNQALHYNTPILTTYIGFNKEFIKEGENGFFVSNEENLLTSIENCSSLNQEEIYLSGLKYSADNMVVSLIESFKKI